MAARGLAARKLRTVIREADFELCQAALAASRNAFAPYSGFAVGCAIRAASGEVFLGANLETGSYDPIHAEVAALGAWNSAGAPPIDTIAVVGHQFWPEIDREAVTTPCGKCRQVIFECAQRSRFDVNVLCCNGLLTRIREHRISYLLPEAFELSGGALLERWTKELLPKLKT